MIDTTETVFTALEESESSPFSQHFLTYTDNLTEQSEHSENSELPEFSKTVKTVKTMIFQILPKQ
jgi:hypothetical protein